MVKGAENVGLVKRKKGRLRRRLIDCYQEDIKEVELKEVDAVDKMKWKSRICTGDP